MENKNFIKKEDTGFCMIKNSILKDKRLSWKAKGIMSFLLSHSNSWIFYKSELMKHSDKDGRESFTSGIRELKETGYLEIIKIKNDKGQFIGNQWLLHNSPKENNLNGNGKTKERKTRSSEKPVVSKTTSNNTNNKNINNNNSFSKEKEYSEKSESNKPSNSSKIKNSQIKLKEDSKTIKKEILSNRKLIPLNNKIKEIIQYWNKHIVKPCHKHTFDKDKPFDKQSGIIYNTYKNLVEILKNYEKEDIYSCIDIFNTFLKNKNPKYLFLGLQVNIDSFFKLSPYISKELNKLKINPLKKHSINSWFEIIANCPEEDIHKYLMSSFGGIVKDKNPKLSKTIEKTILKVSSGRRVLTGQENQHIVKISQQCIDFYNKNKKRLILNHYQNCHTIAKLLIENNNDINIQTYFFISDDYWQNKAPKILKQLNYMK